MQWRLGLACTENHAEFMQANFSHKLTLTICPVIELLVVISTILLRFYGFHHVFEYGNNNNHVISGIQYGPTEVIIIGRLGRPRREIPVGGKFDR